MIAPLQKKPLPALLKAMQKALLKALPKALLILLACVLMFAVQTALALLGARTASLFDYSAFDPNHAFAWISVHHVVQGAAALIVMALLSLLFKLSFHLGLGEKRMGMRIVLWFTVIIAVYQFAIWFVLNAFHLTKPFAYPVTFKNVLGVLSFQLLLSGTSEELLFRAFPVTLLMLAAPKSYRLFNNKVELPLSVILAAVLFSLGHVNWALNPFRLQYDILQLLYALAMGIIQGWAYVKTRSVVYPMMMHGISNVLVTVLSIVMPLLF